MPGYTPYNLSAPIGERPAASGADDANAKGNSQHNVRKKRQPWGWKKARQKTNKKGERKPHK